MSLKQQAKQALDAIGGVSGGSHLLQAQDNGRHFLCELTALDAVGCSTTSIVVRSDELANATIERLKSISDALSKRLTYLLEPISPIEIDADGCVVQMRSNPPQKGDDGTTYYELLARRGGELSLNRYNKASSGQRQAIAAHVTREVLLRLVEDFSAALD